MRYWKSNNPQDLFHAPIVLCIFLLFPPDICACTTIIVGKAATRDGSVLLAHNEELGNNSAHVYVVVPRKPRRAGECYTLFSGAKIPQPTVTYAYIASKVFNKSHYPGDFTMGVNEHQVSVANNMAWTRDYATGESDDPCSVDGRGLIWTEFTQLVLERARTAREGVELIGRLVEEHGLTGDPGTMFGIADPGEGWFVEVAQGRQWIARRVPDDKAVVYANTFRTGAVDLDDAQNILHSPRLVEYAVEKGWHESGHPFDFAEAYGWERERSDPANTLRHEMVERKLAQIGGGFTVEHLKGILRWHYEGTERAHPDFSVSPHASASRNVCCMETEVSGVAQLRDRLPAEIGGVLWLCMGTPCCGVYIPYYMGHNRFPAPFCRAKATCEPDSAYWVFSDLADAAEGFQPGGRLFVRNHWESFERHAELLREAVEAKARSLHEKSPEAAHDFLTWYSNALAHQALSDARELRSAARGKRGE